MNASDVACQKAHSLQGSISMTKATVKSNRKLTDDLHVFLGEQHLVEDAL